MYPILDFVADTSTRLTDFVIQRVYNFCIVNKIEKGNLRYNNIHLNKRDLIKFEPSTSQI